MLYDMSNPLHRGQFTARASAIAARGTAIVELTERRPRPLSMPAYAHAAIAYLAGKVGVSPAWAKERYFKAAANPAIFTREGTDPLTGEAVTWQRSIADVDAEDLRAAVQAFRAWALARGIYIPEPADVRAVELMQLETQRTE